MTLRMVTLGDSTLDSCRYSGGAGTSAPEIVAQALGAELHQLARDGHDPSLAKWITDMERARALLESFNAAIAAAAAAHGAHLVDLCKAFRESAGSAVPWIVSRIEPSAEGARQIARLLGEVIANRA